MPTAHLSRSGASDSIGPVTTIEQSLTHATDVLPYLLVALHCSTPPTRTWQLCLLRLGRACSNVDAATLAEQRHALLLHRRKQAQPAAQQPIALRRLHRRTRCCCRPCVAAALGRAGSSQGPAPGLVCVQAAHHAVVDLLHRCLQAAGCSGAGACLRAVCWAGGGCNLGAGACSRKAQL